MTCRCKHQFCYMCGGNWAADHVCSGNFMGAAYNANAPCCDCTCCDEACGPLACVFKFPFKLILYILFWIVVLLIFINKILIIVMLMVFVLLAGLFFFSFDYICTLCDEGETLCAFTLLMLFPVAMIIGVGIAIRDVLCDVIAD